MADSKKKDDDTGQKAAAESLRQQISDLVDGKVPVTKPQSLRDFVDRKMAEDRAGSKKKDG